jgi:phosphatidylglycerol lysyltransferase
MESMGMLMPHSSLSDCRRAIVIAARAFATVRKFDNVEAKSVRQAPVSRSALRRRRAARPFASLAGRSARRPAGSPPKELDSGVPRSRGLPRMSRSAVTTEAPPALPDPRWPADARRARDLVMAHGWNATAYQIVNPGIAHWFAPEGDAVVGYVRAAGVRVVAGAPVCAPERLADVAAAFERDAAAAGDGVCYFGAEARLAALYRDGRRHARALLGAQPAWDPARWADAVAGHASLRAQLNRARNKGVRVAEWPARDAGASPALRRVLGAWLASRGLPPLHFLVEPATLDRLDDRRVLVATRGDDGSDGEVVAFTVLSPVPARGGWLVEQFPRAPGAPNGTVELLLDAAVRAIAADGARYVTLGLAPLARPELVGAAPSGEDDPLWLRLAFQWVRAHGRRFYNFAGLEAFKAKFRPERWEPVYAIAGGRRFPARALYAIAAAFGARSPVTLVGAALARAVGAETRWAARHALRRRGA